MVPSPSRIRAAAAAGVFSILALSSIALAADPSSPAEPAKPAASAKPAAAAKSAATAPKVPAAAPKTATPPSFTKADCKDMTIKVSWKGQGVHAVDWYSAGPPFLQQRKDPAPGQTSLEATLGDEWKGRKVDVRLFDNDAKLLDTRSVECKAS